MYEFLKRFGIESIIISIICIIFGIIIIFSSNYIINIIEYLIGIMLIIIGIFKILCNKNKYNLYDFYKYDFKIGIIILLMGILMIIFNKVIINIVKILIGIYFLLIGINKIYFIYKLKKLNIYYNWILLLILAIITLIVGMYILIKPEIIFFSIGIIVVIYNILNIIFKSILLIELKKNKDINSLQ